MYRVDTMCTADTIYIYYRYSIDTIYTVSPGANAPGAQATNRMGDVIIE